MDTKVFRLSLCNNHPCKGILVKFVQSLEKSSNQIAHLEFHLSFKRFCVVTDPNRVSLFVKVLPEMRNCLFHNIITVRVTAFKFIQIHSSFFLGSSSAGLGAGAAFSFLGSGALAGFL